MLKNRQKKCFLCFQAVFELMWDSTAEKNMTNTLTLVPVGTDVGFDDHLEVLLY